MKRFKKPGIILLIIFNLVLFSKIAVCQDYEGDFCNSELVEKGPTGQYGMLETLCISLSKYDGEQIAITWKNKKTKFIEGGNEAIFKQVSPGVFERESTANKYTTVSFFRGERIRIVTQNKVVFTRFMDTDGSVLYKIIYTR
ncbi:MAG: hypothetical protein WCR72_03565 [Bacteroidota bacterium]